MSQTEAKRPRLCISTLIIRWMKDFPREWAQSRAKHLPWAEGNSREVIWMSYSCEPSVGSAPSSWGSECPGCEGGNCDGAVQLPLQWEVPSHSTFSSLLFLLLTLLLLFSTYLTRMVSATTYTNDSQIHLQPKPLNWASPFHILTENRLLGIFSCKCHRHFKFKMSKCRIIIPNLLLFCASTVPIVESSLNLIAHSAPFQSNPTRQRPEYFTFFPFLDRGVELSNPECWLTYSILLREWLTHCEQSNGLTKMSTS